MKVDYKAHPEIPKGCSQNLNKKTGLYQVYREYRYIDPETKQKKVTRDTIGSIRDGVFRFGENYLLREKNKALEAENAALKASLKAHETIQETNKDVKENAEAVTNRIKEALNQTNLDRRRQESVLIPLAPLSLAALMTALTGQTDAVVIQDYLEHNKEFFAQYLPELLLPAVSHDTIRRSLLLAKPCAMQGFHTNLSSSLIKDLSLRVLNVDGQAVRGSGRRTKDKPEVHGAQMLMNVFDANNRVCLASKLIAKKTNEITVGPQMLAELDLNGCVVTADAMSCQVAFVDTVLEQGANYLISLKGNQDRTLKDVRSHFSTADASNIFTHTPEIELDHGRIEERRIRVLPGRFVSKELLEKWNGLRSGSVVEMLKIMTIKATGQRSEELSYYMTSLPASEDTSERIYQVLRSHWSVENNLHYMLDMFWHQDQMRASHPRYIANCSMLFKMALAFLENYRYWLWAKGLIDKEDGVSIKTLQKRCQNPRVALECLAAGLGLIH